MNAPIKLESIEEFVKESQIFEKTRKKMETYLRKYFEENSEEFIEDLGCNFNEFISKCKFIDAGISFSRNYSYKTDYISVWIEIRDRNDSYLREYTAFYDYELNCIDDKMVL